MIKVNKNKLLVVVILSLSFSGCTLINPPDNINFTGDIHTSDGEFRMNGTIVNSSPDDPSKFRNTTIHLYHVNGTLIRSHRVGTLERSAKISITSEQVPEYVVINSPDFWQRSILDPGVSIFYFELTEEGIYSEHGVESKNDLPVELTTD